MKTTTIAVVLLTSLLTACSQQVQTGNALQDGPTMKQVLESHSGLGERPAPRSLSWDDTNTYASYTRSEQRELQGLFPRLPNPDLCMYVFPHITPENATVPGYTSCFPMFERNHYALPGELSARLQEHQ